MKRKNLRSRGCLTARPWTSVEAKQRSTPQCERSRSFLCQLRPLEFYWNTLVRKLSDCLCLTYCSYDCQKDKLTKAGNNAISHQAFCSLLFHVSWFPWLPFTPRRDAPTKFDVHYFPERWSSEVVLGPKLLSYIVRRICSHLHRRKKLGNFNVQIFSKKWMPEVSDWYIHIIYVYRYVGISVYYTIYCIHAYLCTYAYPYKHACMHTHK